MKLVNYLFCVITISIFTNCRKENSIQTILEEHIVISKLDSISKSTEKTNQLLFPIIPQEMKWYSDLVFIMDKKDKVFIYQTQNKVTNQNAKFDYPNYIGLKPEYLITIDSKDFVSFLKNNNDIFAIFPNKEMNSNFFYIVSETDTIKNTALFDLERALNETKARSIYLMRKTTEEENVVLEYKRDGEEFEPEKINWSNHFYNGKVKPFTKEYDAYEKEIKCNVYAKETFTKKLDIIYM
jgi:hypothetical protein